MANKNDLSMSASDLLRHDSLVVTPSGLHVPESAFGSLVKAEARKMAKQDNSFPHIFSRLWTAQNMVAYGAREKPVGTPSFSILYEAAKKSFIDRILIQARADQMKQVWQRALTGKQVGFKVVHDRHDDPDFEENDQIKARCREMEEILGNPCPVEFLHLYPQETRIHPNLKDFISRMVKAELIIDRKVLYRYKRRNGKGYAAFHWLPGATIRPVHEAIRQWAKKHQAGGKITEATLDLIGQKTGFDIASSSYCQLIDGEIVAAFGEDEISLHIANPSDEVDRNGYGESRLEISLDVTATLMMAWRYNRELFNVNYPEHILTVSGDYNKEGFEAFKQQILSEAGGVGRNHRLPMIPSDDENFKVEAHKLRDTPKDMLFDQFFRMMVNMKCAAYGAHPTIMNFTMDAGGGSSSMFGHNPDSEIEFSKEHGFKPALMDMCEWLTDSIIKPTYDDLRIMLVGLDEEDEKAQLDMLVERGKSHRNRNELRVMEGEEPIGDPEDPDNPWNYPSDAPLATYLTAIAGKKQMEGGGDYGDEFEEPDLDEEADAGPVHDEQGVIEEPMMAKSEQGLYLEITIEDD